VAITALLASIEAAGKIVYARRDNMPRPWLLGKVSPLEGIAAPAPRRSQGAELALFDQAGKMVLRVSGELGCLAEGEGRFRLFLP